MSAIRLSLRAGERIFVNGAVLRVRRKTSIELLNDATFLLEQHVLQAEAATTPLRQLYFIAQTMLIDPEGAESCRPVFEDSRWRLCRAVSDTGILDGLEKVARLMREGRTLDTMKTIRRLIPLEDAILAGA